MREQLAGYPKFLILKFRGYKVKHCEPFKWGVHGCAVNDCGFKSVCSHFEFRDGQDLKDAASVLSHEALAGHVRVVCEPSLLREPCFMQEMDVPLSAVSELKRWLNHSGLFSGRSTCSTGMSGRAFWSWIGFATDSSSTLTSSLACVSRSSGFMPSN